MKSEEFSTLLNYSLIGNITCSGLESSVSECTVNETDCLPWCPHNIVLRCFGKCTLHTDICSSMLLLI